MITYVKISGVWKQVSNILIKQNGVWNEMPSTEIKIGGSWKTTYYKGTS